MSNKLERDIEEVLAKIERFPPKEPLRSRVRRRLAGALGGVGRAFGGLPRPRVSVGQVMLLGLVLTVIWWMLRGSLGSVVHMFIIAAIVLFVGAFIYSLRGQSASRMPEKRWRGEPMDLSEGGGPSSWWDRWRSRR